MIKKVVLLGCVSLFFSCVSTSKFVKYQKETNEKFKNYINLKDQVATLDKSVSKIIASNKIGIEELEKLQIQVRAIGINISFYQERSNKIDEILLGLAKAKESFINTQTRFKKWIIIEKKLALDKVNFLEKIFEESAKSIITEKPIAIKKPVLVEEDKK